MDTSSFPSIATFILISGFYHSWQRLTGPNLQSLIQNLVHVHGPWMNIYFGQLYMEDERNPSLHHAYALTAKSAIFVTVRPWHSKAATILILI